MLFEKSRIGHRDIPIRKKSRQVFDGLPAFLFAPLPSIMLVQSRYSVP